MSEGARGRGREGGCMEEGLQESARVGREGRQRKDVGRLARRGVREGCGRSVAAL